MGRSPLTKIDIINLVSDDTGLSKVKAEEAVEMIIQTIKESLQSGESVILRRFGSFQVREKNARVGRNPKTGQEAPISARRVVRFKAGKTLQGSGERRRGEISLNFFVRRL